jgi:glutamate decarboxylase
LIVTHGYTLRCNPGYNFFSSPFFLDVQKGQEQLVPVVNYHTPEELYKLFDFTLPNKGVGLEGMSSH